VLFGLENGKTKKEKSSAFVLPPREIEIQKSPKGIEVEIYERVETHLTIKV